MFLKSLSNCEVYCRKWWDKVLSLENKEGQWATIMASLHGLRGHKRQDIKRKNINPRINVSSKIIYFSYVGSHLEPARVCFAWEITYLNWSTRMKNHIARPLQAFNMAWSIHRHTHTNILSRFCAFIRREGGKRVEKAMQQAREQQTSFQGDQKEPKFCCEGTRKRKIKTPLLSSFLCQFKFLSKDNFNFNIS